MNRRRALTIAVLAGAVMASGCWESTDVTIAEAGKFKGKKDPLLDAKSTAERQEVLQKRFQLVQADR